MTTHSPKSPLKSMTGYAQARTEQNGWTLRLSLRSVNHRFLDLHFRLPEGFEMFEPLIRQTLRERLRRGHVDVTLHFEAGGPAAVHINRDVAAAYLQAAEELRRQTGVSAEPDVVAILRLPGVIAPPEVSIEEEQERLEKMIAGCLEDALGRLEQMRQSEGRALAEDMRRRLERIAGHAEKIQRLAERARPLFARRLEARLKELLGQSPLDPARIAQEAAIEAERGDVSEELARLESHLAQFEKLIAAGGEAGKKLDFLLQEMQREANTLLSKTPGVETEGLAMTDRALDVKSEIEKLREQVQNVE